MIKEILKILEKKSIKIIPAKAEDIPEVITMVNGIPDALLHLTPEVLNQWIDAKQSLVARTMFGHGKIIGHQGCGQWPKSGWFELRSAVVLPEFRGGGTNTRMKITMIEHIKNEHPEAVFVGFTEAASKSRGILQKNGFSEIAMEEVPDEFFDICESPDCWKKGGSCGCRVYTLKQ